MLTACCESTTDDIRCIPVPCALFSGSLAQPEHIEAESAPLPSRPLFPVFSQDDERMLQDIQKFYNTVIEELPSNIADLI